MCGPPNAHGSLEDHQRRAALLRKCTQEQNRSVGLLIDLQGPKIRLGSVLPNTILKKGEEIVFSTKKIKDGDSKKITINYASFPKDVKKG